MQNEDKQGVELTLSQEQYVTLLQRYKELAGGGGAGSNDAIAFDLDSHITEIDTGKIDSDYMNSRFKKYLKELQGGVDEHAREATLAELQRSFASLSQEEQKFAGIFLRDIHRGDVNIDPEHSFRDYLAEYQVAASNRRVQAISSYLGVNEEKLTAMMTHSINEETLNEYGRFDDLKNTIDKQKAKAYFEEKEGTSLPPFKVNIKATNLLREFILNGGVELDGADNEIEEKSEG